jgi:Big-like domain-containing protein/lectin family protein/HYDIN/CFA65/VesB family protein/centrosomal CEP192-like protein/putative pyrroloquinoline-quinone-binding quinoprotein
MHRSVMRRLMFGATISAVLTAVVAVAPAAHADNFTISSDVSRSGWDSHEPGLAPAQVSAGDFGQQFSVQLAGSIYSQPLVVGNTVVVTTEKANAYGISASTGSILWQRSFGAPFQSSTIGCGDLTPDLGSTSTPVYDPASNTVYLTTKIADGVDAQHPHWYLHAINPADGSERPGFPLVLQGVADNDPTVTFNPFLQMQRPGLLFAHGTVYIGFGSHCDLGAWRGWIMAVGVIGAPAIKSLFVTEAANGGGAGVWGAGGGLVTDGDDANGNPRVFFATGNGLSPAVGSGTSPSPYLGDSVVRVGPNASGHLAAADFFAPSDAPTLDLNDTDLGSGGPAALSDSFGTPSHPHLLVQDGKDGRLFLLDRDNLGGRGQGPSGGDAVVQTIGPFKGIWGHPAVYGAEGGWLYYVENNGPLRAYQRGVTASGDPALTAVGASSGTFGYTSGSPIVTSDGTTAGSALVWVVYSSGSTGSGGQLRAYDAVPSNGVLNLRWSAAIGNASKFEMPATSGGRVFVGTRDGKLFAFGRPATVALYGSTVDAGQVPVGGSVTTAAHLTASTTITVSGASATAPFTADATGLPRTLAANDTIDIPITFAPTVPGTASSTLTLTTSLGQVTLDLHGTGTQPGLSASPSPLVFGAVATSQTKTYGLNITNTGTTSETVSSTSLPSAPFTVTGAPAAGTVIGAQQSLALSVTYAPTVAGTNSDSLAITSTHGTLTVPLTGSGETGQAHLAFRPSTTDFGRVVVGMSRTLRFDIMNTGDIPLTITKAKAPAGVFTSPSPLSEGITLGPDDVLHQDVTFTPTAIGPASGSYLVTADDGQGEQTVTLTGTGITGSALPTPTGSGWSRNGATTVSGSDLVLTPAQPFLAGSAFSTTTVPSDGLDAHFTAQLGGGTGADGLTFTLLPASSPATSLGATGGGLGYGGLTNAVAVALDTHANATDPSSNFVGVATGTLGALDQLAYVTTSSNVGPLTSGTHDVDINIYGGHLRVIVDGDLTIDQPINLPATVRPGFTAATGGLTDQHVVRNVRITTPAPPVLPPIRTDTTVAVNGRNTLTTPTLTTAVAGERLVALVGYSGPSTSAQTATVSGAGLTWRLVRRTNAQHGTAEVWTAVASTRLIGVTVRAAPRITGYSGSLTLRALRDVTGIGVSTSASALSGAPTVLLTTTRSGSMVLAAGNDWDRAVARTPAAGQVIVHQYADSTIRDTYWAQSLTVPVPATGTVVRIVDTSPTTDRYNFAAVELLAIQPDRTPPTVTVTAPTGGQTLTGTKTFTATASDNTSLVGVLFLVDGLPVGNPVTKAPYAVDVDTTTLTNGGHTVSARAIDSSNNVATSVGVAVTVNNPPADITPPTIALTTPITGSTVGGSVTVAASASDNKGVASVQFYLDGAPLGGPLTAAPYQLTWNTTAVANGNHTLAAAALDATGNVGTSGSITITVSN